MRNYLDLFDIRSTVMPFSSAQLNNVVKSKVTSGFVLCNYDELATTIRAINSAATYNITRNPSEIYDKSNNPTAPTNVIIQVEGLRQNDNLYGSKAAVINDTELSSFNTYSQLMKEEITELKNACIKKLLWNTENIQRWVIYTNAKMTEDIVDSVITSYDLFKEYVLTTEDLSSFVESLSKEAVNKYIAVLRKNGEALLTKYKTEIYSHFNNIVKAEQTVTVKKPIISKIFVLSTLVNTCKKDWPTISVIGLDKSSYDSLCWFI